MLTVYGALMTLDHSVVRATAPNAASEFGRGLHIKPSCAPTVCDPNRPANVTVRGSLIERNNQIGVFVAGSQLTVEATVVRGTLPEVAGQAFGHGIGIEACGEPALCKTGVARSNATVRGSLIEQNHDAGINVFGSDVTVETTMVRATLPRAVDQTFGRGISIQPTCTVTGCDDARSTAIVRKSLVEENHEAGVHMMAADVTIEATVVRATLPRASDNLAGRGISIQSCSPLTGCAAFSTANATIVGSLVDQTHDMGVVASDSRVVMEGTLVRATMTRADGLFGDGIAIAGSSASATLTAIRVEESARSGVSNFGAHISIVTTHIQCSAFDLIGEPFTNMDPIFENRGGNLCGCGSTTSCKSVSAGLAPPDVSMAF
jgi:hypothetical protein